MKLTITVKFRSKHWSPHFDSSPYAYWLDDDRLYVEPGNHVIVPTTFGLNIAQVDEVCNLPDEVVAMANKWVHSLVEE